MLQIPGAFLPSNLTEKRTEVCSYAFRTAHFDSSKRSAFDTTLEECKLVIETYIDRQPTVIWDEYDEGRTKFLVQPSLTELVGIHKVNGKISKCDWYVRVLNLALCVGVTMQAIINTAHCC